MKINLLKEKINVNPEEELLVTKKRFFEIFFRLYYMKDNKTLSDNEIELLSSLCSDEPTTITKNNLPPIIRKLNQKQLMVDKELSTVCKMYKERFKDNVQIVFNFSIV